MDRLNPIYNDDDTNGNETFPKESKSNDERDEQAAREISLAGACLKPPLLDLVYDSNLFYIKRYNLHPTLMKFS